MRIGPVAGGAVAAAGEVAVRRRTARMRAMTSAAENGLTT